ncbi:hypothetical protein [Actibacterium sp. 188UL27-1]|uniref:hypothetical protein n=1 Tax=Actibacterium sp. 188UL27-1 TaxID=2786961 RepID=UPI00195B32D0|nr:hypothetical protein [Actibacterium sp. 188UL27-1]MBM7067992.1 hypothetical protein [Actibacterium sp. 188UL27-1]
MIRSVVLPALLPVLAAVAVAAFGLLVPLPHLFAYSDTVILGVGAMLLALGLAMMLPETWLFTPAERLRHAFVQRHAVTPDTAETALSLIARAQRQGHLLRHADNGFVPELKARVDHTADSLDGIARLIFDEPSEGRRNLALINRADLLVEAVQNHSALRRDKSNEAQIASARTSVSAALDAFAGAISAADERRIEAQIQKIDTASDVADTLFQAMRGPRT